MQSVGNSPCECEHNGELHSWVMWNVKLLLLCCIQLLLPPASSCLYMTSLTLVTSNIYMQVPPAYSCLYNVHCTLYTIQLQVPCIQLPVHDKGDTSKLKLTRVTL